MKTIILSSLLWMAAFETFGQTPLTDAGAPAIKEEQPQPVTRIPRGGVARKTFPGSPRQGGYASPSEIPTPASPRPLPTLSYADPHTANRQVAAEAPRGTAFSIDFPGGTADVLVDLLREATGDLPNVMISPDMREAEFPSFKLQNITLDDLFQALNGIAGASVGGTWQLSGSREPIWVLNRTAVWSNAVDPLTGMPLNTAPLRMVRVFAVGHFLKEFNIDDVTTSIQTAWGLAGDEPGAQLKFHKDTNLLIVTGTHEQLEILSQVLSALKDELQSKQSDRAEMRAAEATVESTKEKR